MARRRRRKIKSKTRGGASAPKHCKTGLRDCMTGEIRKGRAFKTVSKSCMVEFNQCRLGRKRKGTKRRRRAA